MRMGEEARSRGALRVFISTRQDSCARLGDARSPPRAHDLHVVATVSAAFSPILVRSGEIIMTHAQVQTVVDCMTSSVNI